MNLGSEGMICRAVHAQGHEASGVPDLESIWSHTLGDPRIRIAILDGPVDRTHPCFRGAQLTEYTTLASGNAEPGPTTDHGTQIASIIFGQHGSGVDGAAPQCSGLILPVFSGAQNGPASCSQLDLARAILKVVELGANVINVSGGQLASRGEAHDLLVKAIKVCADNNVLLVAAAGNDGCDCLHVPAALQHVLAVGAMGANGEPLESSNWGHAYRTCGILALGENVPAAQRGGGTVAKTGTSFATPLVSGVAGLLLSVQLQRGETPNPDAVRRALIASATPCDPDQTDDCRRVLAGRLNIPGALKFIAQQGVKMSEVMTAETKDEAALAPSEIPERGADLASPIAARLVTPRAQQVVSASEAIAPQTPDGGLSPTFPSSALPTNIRPSDCGCGGGETCSCASTKSQQIVFALGTLRYDFGTEANRDAFFQSMRAAGHDPAIPSEVIEHLNAKPYEAESLIWTLNLDATPIYAVVPAGPFASTAYENLRKAFAEQMDIGARPARDGDDGSEESSEAPPESGVELVSIPGVIVGKIALLSGQIVPTVLPSVRGMFSWNSKTLIESILKTRPRAGQQREAYDRRANGLANFLSRVYYDLRNLGLAPQDRALNFSATNAFQAAQVMNAAGDLELDRIVVRKSPVCRPESECYDVELGFFNPTNTNIANRIFRFTVDVSGVMPVSIGQIRDWSKRA